MTGFGKGQAETDLYQLEVEIKSVNHRFLDIQLRMPNELNQYELTLRQLIKKKIQRGRVEIWVQIHEKTEQTKEVNLRWDLMEKMVTTILQKTATTFGEQLNVAAIIPSLLTREEIIEIKTSSVEDPDLEKALLSATQEALSANDQMRMTEGQKIKVVLEQNRQTVQQSILQVAALNETYEADYQQRLQNKLNEYLQNKVDESRLLTETAILIERGDIHEELDRMQIHLQAMQEMLAVTVPIGRKLDFLIQEMNREVNTIGSKSTAIAIKKAVVEMKTAIEQIREQVQNVQ